MSLFDNYNSSRIYEEMEHEEKKNYKSIGKVGQQIVAIILLLSIGFACGNLYALSLGSIDGNLKLGQNSDTPVIPTSTINSSSNSTDAFSISQITTLTLNSVVEISTEVSANNLMMEYLTTGKGSGIIISKDGYILTNRHVIEGASQITVKLTDGTSYTATIIGSDSKLDIAILKIDATNLSPVTFGDSSILKVGELAVVIGNPLGNLGGTVTDGIISALEREITLGGVSMNLIQTNAAINPGNSGGALFNNKAELVGIIIAKSSGIDIEGLGFAIPINDVKDAIQEIIDLGYAKGRAFLGVSLEDASYSYGFFNFSYTIGAGVKSVVPNSGAANAGVQVGDIIVGVNNTKISTSSDVISTLANCNVGDKVTLSIIRNNSQITLDVTLGEYKGE